MRAETRQATQPEHFQKLGNVVFDTLGSDAVCNTVLSELSNGRGGWVITANLDYLRRVARSQPFRKCMEGASLVLADGTLVAWLLRLGGAGRQVQRVAGADLIWLLGQAALRERISVVLIGGRDQETCEKAASRLSENLVVGAPLIAHSPPYGFESIDSELERIRSCVTIGSAAVVFCGLGSPKQDILIEDLHTTNPENWYVGVGAAIDIAAGRFRRAPELWQQCGFEWLYRLIQEPRRLFRRYIIEDLPYAVEVLFATAIARSVGGVRGFRFIFGRLK